MQGGASFGRVAACSRVARRRNSFAAQQRHHRTLEIGVGALYLTILFGASTLTLLCFSQDNIMQTIHCNGTDNTPAACLGLHATFATITLPFLNRICSSANDNEHTSFTIRWFEKLCPSHTELTVTVGGMDETA